MPTLSPCTNSNSKILLYFLCCFSHSFFSDQLLRSSQSRHSLYKTIWKYTGKCNKQFWIYPHSEIFHAELYENSAHSIALTFPPNFEITCCRCCCYTPPACWHPSLCLCSAFMPYASTTMYVVRAHTVMPSSTYWNRRAIESCAKCFQGKMKTPKRWRRADGHRVLASKRTGDRKMCVARAYERERRERGRQTTKNVHRMNEYNIFYCTLVDWLGMVGGGGGGCRH